MMSTRGGNFSSQVTGWGESGFSSSTAWNNRGSNMDGNDLSVSGSKPGKECVAFCNPWGERDRSMATVLNSNKITHPSLTEAIPKEGCTTQDLQDRNRLLQLPRMEGSVMPVTPFNWMVWRGSDLLVSSRTPTSVIWPHPVKSMLWRFVAYSESIMMDLSVTSGMPEKTADSRLWHASRAMASWSSVMGELLVCWIIRGCTWQYSSCSSSWSVISIISS